MAVSHLLKDFATPRSRGYPIIATPRQGPEATPLLTPPEATPPPINTLAVLAGYSAQVYKLKEALSGSPELAKVVVSTVDGYQGAENRVIILSLVRSNGHGRLKLAHCGAPPQHYSPNAVTHLQVTSRFILGYM